MMPIIKCKKIGFSFVGNILKRVSVDELLQIFRTRQSHTINEAFVKSRRPGRNFLKKQKMIRILLVIFIISVLEIYIGENSKEKG